MGMAGLTTADYLVRNLDSTEIGHVSPEELPAPDVSKRSSSSTACRSRTGRRNTLSSASRRKPTGRSASMVPTPDRSEVVKQHYASLADSMAALEEKSDRYDDRGFPEDRMFM
ncbi:MAG: hypothetical protein V5A55_09430 [Halovenus sp.]